MRWAGLLTLSNILGKLGLIPPLTPETNYRRVLVRFVGKSFESLAENIESDTSSFENEAIEGAGKFIASVDRLNKRAIRESFTEYFREVEAKKKIADALSIDPATITDEALRDNVDLIKDISEEQRVKIREELINPSSDDKLSERLAVILSASENRSRLIARDQTSKIHSALARARHAAAGATEYFWRTSGDERVRKSHRARDGKKQSYETADLHPGDDVQCRCVADPIL